MSFNKDFTLVKDKVLVGLNIDKRTKKFIEVYGNAEANKQPDCHIKLPGMIKVIHVATLLMDRQRIKDDIDGIVERLDQKIIHYPNMPECPFCKSNLNDKANSGQRYQIFILRELKSRWKL